MSENDRTDTLSINTILVNFKPCPEGLQDRMYKAGAVQVDRDVHASWAPISAEQDVILITLDNSLFLVWRDCEMGHVIVPGDVPLRWTNREDTDTPEIVPSLGDLSELGPQRWHRISAELFSPAALAMLAADGRRPFLRKHWVAVKSVNDYAEVRDVFRRLAEWRRVNAVRTGAPETDPDSLDEVDQAFLRSL